MPTRTTDIERFRKRRHKQASLELFTLDATSDGLVLIAAVGKGFLISDSNSESQQVKVLHLDPRYTPALTAQKLETLTYVDLIEGANRYRFSVSMPEQMFGGRNYYACQLDAAFNDRKPVTG